MTFINKAFPQAWQQFNHANAMWLLIHTLNKFNLLVYVHNFHHLMERNEVEKFSYIKHSFDKMKRKSHYNAN